ncbi:hypothetical protein DFH06DRAFT_1144132 [Mycena polygramma]|nr:hypothetical protein DFH06DRAFT_1144132 [Mycena polygramma]
MIPTLPFLPGKAILGLSCQICFTVFPPGPLMSRDASLFTRHFSLPPSPFNAFGFSTMTINDRHSDCALCTDKFLRLSDLGPALGAVLTQIAELRIRKLNNDSVFLVARLSHLHLNPQSPQVVQKTVLSMCLEPQEERSELDVMFPYEKAVSTHSIASVPEKVKPSLDMYVPVPQSGIAYQLRTRYGNYLQHRPKLAGSSDNGHLLHPLMQPSLPFKLKSEIQVHVTVEGVKRSSTSPRCPRTWIDVRRLNRHQFPVSWSIALQQQTLRLVMAMFREFRPSQSLQSSH